MKSPVLLQIPEEIVSKAIKAELPNELTDPHKYVAEVNEHLNRLLGAIQELPETSPWDVITPERFSKSTEKLAAHQKLGAFWLDLSNQAMMFGALVAWKGRSLSYSLVRSLNSRELIAPALLSRALMELATSTAVQAREAVGVFRAVAASERPTMGDDNQLRRIEETLQKAIWGSRIGSSKMMDKAPLWSRSPYPEPQVEANNIQTAFQKLARGAPEAGGTAFKVYEWLCDVVHPATQGFRVFWESITEIAPGHRRILIDGKGSREQGLIQWLVLWGAGYSSVMIFNTVKGIFESADGVRSRLVTTYELTEPLEGKSR